MDTVLKRAGDLKQALTDFVLDAEGDLAVALETFSAAQLSRSQQQDMHQRSLVVDRFITEGSVGETTPIECFLAEEQDLSQSDRQLLQKWHQAFVGLFEIKQILPDGFELMNWMTARHYTAKVIEAKQLEAMARLKQGEIILTQIAPLDDETWIFSSAWTSLGRLGKPKLAVAIGNFKENYKQHRYSDAPDLLEEAWKSVEKYHYSFIDFFGADEVTLSGHELGKKLAQLQEQMIQQQFDAAGIDSSKSLKEIAEASGATEEDLAEAAEAMGVDAKNMEQLMHQKSLAKMAPTQVELPPHLKNAEQVTALTHPLWGQLFLPNYSRFKNLLEANAINTDDEKSHTEVTKMVKHHLENQEVNRFVWERLAQQYPTQMEATIQATLERPTFSLETDLESLLSEFDKPLKPELPETASVPFHLHELFQEALLEVKKEKSKSKAKPKKTGFGFKK